MCCERERYERQVQKSLSMYETQNTYTVDHRRAVKIFKRSAADQVLALHCSECIRRSQEEPLPHELRPDTVLDATMNYLLHNVVTNLPPANDHGARAAWYDFLWKRTRAIRTVIYCYNNLKLQKRFLFRT